MNYLFFFVHPAKFHAFKHTINTLKEKGHRVDVLITSKDVLEDLVKQEGWEYTNIFPEGRKIKGLPTYIGAAYNLLRTIYRLHKYTKGKKFDLFFTDDLLTIVGWMKGIPSILFQDSDLNVVPESALLMRFATYIISPKISGMGKYEKKKLGYDGYKELAYLHPNYFIPDKSKLKSIDPSKKFYILRLVFLAATHDVGKKGIDNNKLQRIIDILTPHGNVCISSERALPEKYSKYVLQLEKTSDLLHYIYYADMFIGDSQTTTSEAAILGTPSIRYNDFVGKINVMEEKQTRYKLSYGFKTADFEKMIAKIADLVRNKNLKEECSLERDKMLSEKVDLTRFLVWVLENFPISAEKLKSDPDYENNFK